MTQIYADESPPLAGDVHQSPEFHPGFFICAHLRHLRIKIRLRRLHPIALRLWRLRG